MPGAKVGFMTRFGELWREHPLITAAGILTLLLAGARLVPLVKAIFPALLGASGGDEPPIRVKGGSIDLDVIDPNTSTSPWGGNGQNWFPARGRRNSEDIGFAVLNAPNGCPSVFKDAQKLVFKFTNSPGGADDVTIQVSAFTTHVIGVNNFTPPSGRTLSYPGAGTGTWYMRIHQRGGGQPITCKLDASNEVIIFEW
jgi:hypothetical protein